MGKQSGEWLEPGPNELAQQRALKVELNRFTHRSDRSSRTRNTRGLVPAPRSQRSAASLRGHGRRLVCGPRWWPHLRWLAGRRRRWVRDRRTARTATTRALRALRSDPTYELPTHTHDPPGGARLTEAPARTSQTPTDRSTTQFLRAIELVSTGTSALGNVHAARSDEHTTPGGMRRARCPRAPHVTRPPLVFARPTSTLGDPRAFVRRSRSIAFDGRGRFPGADTDDLLPRGGRSPGGRVTLGRWRCRMIAEHRCALGSAAPIESGPHHSVSVGDHDFGW